MKRSAMRAATSIVTLVLFAGITLAESPATRRAPTTQQSKYLRFVPDDADGGVLQTSILTFRNDAGVTVDLIGAVHIADAAYFDRLNREFEGYDAVLYELVRPRGSRVPQKRDRELAATRPRKGGALSWVGTFQRFLRDHLELEFQLEAIDYEKSNFVHADLELEEMLRMQEERGESFMRLMLRAMLREMGRNPTGAGQPGLGELLLALQAPDRARQLKLVLARQFEQMEDILAGMEGPQGSVLITERNKAALKVLEDRIERGDRRLAIFYGAGHLKGMEEILTTEMEFEQVGEPRWLIAWDLTAPPTTQPATTQPK